MMKPLILETKLRPPDSSGMLVRTRLYDLLIGCEKRLTSICADAGYGKTTLMAQYFAANAKSSVWYQLGHNDRDIAIFLRHLIEGVRRKLGGGLDVSLDNALTATTDVSRNWEAILTLLINQLGKHQGDPLVFCFDEFHLVNNFQPLTRAIQFLINYLPHEFRVFIASREKPTLTLGRLRTQRAVLEINTENLRFTIEEAAQLLTGCCLTPLNNRELAALHEATEGWPVALVLSRDLIDAEHRMPADLAPELFGASGAIAGYLAEEVWAGLDEGLKRFLMESSLIETVEVNICDIALADGRQTNPLYFLREMERRNLMTACLESGKSYRYHPLMRKFLIDKLIQNVSPSEIEKFHLRFGEAYSTDGNFDQAINHFLRSGSPELAADVIESRGESILESGNYETLVRWISEIPASLVYSRPWLTFFSARLNVVNGDTQQAERLFLVAEKGFQKAGDERGRFCCACAMSEFFFMQNHHAKSLKKAKEALKWAAAPADMVSTLSRIATQHLVLGNTHSAGKLLTRAQGLCDESMQPIRIKLEVDALAPSWFAGEFDEALEDTIRLQKEAGPNLPAFSRFQILCWKAMNLYEMACYDEAVKTIGERKDYLGTEDRLQRTSFELIRGIIFLSVDNGNEGLEILEKVEREGSASIFAPFSCLNYMGAYHRRHGHIAKAMKASGRKLSIWREKGQSYSIASCLVNQAAGKLQLAGGELEAGIALDEAFVLAKKHGYKYILTQVHFCWALLALSLGQSREALKETTSALSIAARHQHNNFMVQEGRINLELLVFAFENEVERNYLQSIFRLIGPEVLPNLNSLLKSSSPRVRLAAIGTMGASCGIKAAPYIRNALHDDDPAVRRTANSELAQLRTVINNPGEILTKRENQILELMAQGLSNAEIGGKLFISECTVKTHATRIFNKLAMTRRTQAAAFCRNT